MINNFFQAKEYTLKKTITKKKLIEFVLPRRVASSSLLEKLTDTKYIEVFVMKLSWVTYLCLITVAELHDRQHWKVGPVRTWWLSHFNSNGLYSKTWQNFRSDLFHKPYSSSKEVDFIGIYRSSCKTGMKETNTSWCRHYSAVYMPLFKI